MRGQAAHVALQMCLHLVFGLHHKAQADPVAQPPGQQAQAKSARILLDQLRCVDKIRLGQKMGKIDAKVWHGVLMEMLG